MNKRIFFSDLYVIDSLVKEDQIKSDALSMLRSMADKPRLEVSIDATHSGVLTNLRVYPGIKVEEGYKTFFAKKNGGLAEVGAPILRHHNSHSDSIGRVVSASFTKLKEGDAFYKDYMNPEMRGGKGSGVVNVKGLISDGEAIEKIIDERYLSVSAGHATNKMYCSICAEDLFGDSCMHYPGRMYNDEMEPDEEGLYLCYGITDKMTYHEVSMVNIPAQPPAKIVDVKWEDKNQMKQNDNLTLSSLTNLNTSAIKTISLTDSDGKSGLNLLSGNEIGQPTKVISIPRISNITADKLRNIYSPDDSSNNDHLEESTSEKTEMVQNENIDNNVEDENMTNTDVDTVARKDFEELQNKFTGLESTLADEKQKVSDLTDQVSAKDEQIKDLTEKNNALLDEMKTNLATVVAGYRIRLNKPGTDALDSDEKRQEYIASLASRSLDSLKDSLADLELEVREAKDDTVDVTDGERVESPLAPDQQVPTTDNQDRPVRKSGLDKIFD